MSNRRLHIVNNEQLNHVGHDSLKQIYFFTKEENGSNKLVEIPYSFEGTMYLAISSD